MDKKYILIGILILAAILRLYGLSRGDTLTDEVLYAFRAVGPMDFDEAALQTTPLEWFDPDIPSWTKLSFHDHPPLVFWTQHFFIKIFGENNFAFRFPSALLGIASVYLLYLIGKKLYSEKIGLIAAALSAVTVNQVFVARSGLQEPYVIFFILLISLLFLKSLENKKYIIWTGVALGFGLLTKYTSFILVPIFLTYLLIFRRDYFLKKRLWIGTLLALVIFSPVILYNTELYRAAGHFDFQFSGIFQERPEVWKVQPGKEIGTLADRIKNYMPGFVESNSWVFLVLAFAAVLFFLISLLKKPKEVFGNHPFLAIAIFYLASLMLLIGPSFRFLSMLGPFLALAAGIFIYKAYEKFPEKKEKLAPALFALILVFEVGYSINSEIIYYPKGPETWAWSRLRLDNYNWGYNELAKYLAGELSGKMPAIAFEPKYTFIEKFQEKSLMKSRAKGLAEYPALIVYDANVQTAAQLWVLDRLQIYHAWPVIPTETYVSFLQEQGFDYFYGSGFKTGYFIIPTDKVPLKNPEKLTGLGALLEKELIANKIVPVSIKNKRGEEAFRVYKFPISS